MGGPDSNFEFGRLPARSARAACLPRLRDQQFAILNKEGKGDVTYEIGHVVGCAKRHPRVGGARFCPPPVGDFFEIQFLHNDRLGVVWMWVSCRDHHVMQLPIF